MMGVMTKPNLGSGHVLRDYVLSKIIPAPKGHPITFAKCAVCLQAIEVGQMSAFAIARGSMRVVEDYICPSKHHHLAFTADIKPVHAECSWAFTMTGGVH